MRPTRRLSVRSQQGFTLLEMLIAIAVFVVIAAASYLTLNSFLKTRATLDVQNDKLHGLQQLFALLERDIRYAVHRPVRSNYQNEADPDRKAMCLKSDQLCADGDHLRLTRHQMEPQSYNVTGGSLLRVGWRLEGDELYRVAWATLDRDQDATERRRLIIKDVESLEIKPYLADATDTAQINTTVSNSGLDSDTRSDNQFPASVLEVLITINGSEYRRLFEVANGS